MKNYPYDVCYELVMCWTPGPYFILFLIFPITSKSNYFYPRFTDEKTVIQETISPRITGLVSSFFKSSYIPVLGLSVFLTQSRVSLTPSSSFFNPFSTIHQGYSLKHRFDHIATLTKNGLPRLLR